MYRLLACLLLLGCSELLRIEPSSVPSETLPPAVSTSPSGPMTILIFFMGYRDLPKHNRTVEYVVESLRALKPDAVAIQGCGMWKRFKRSSKACLATSFTSHRISKTRALPGSITPTCQSIDRLSDLQRGRLRLLLPSTHGFDEPRVRNWYSSIFT